jgi:hypothetical protein
MDIAIAIVWHSILLFLWGGSVLAIIVGALLLLAPLWLARINRRAAFWVDMSGLAGELDRPHWLERHIYRHHRLVGALLMSGSVYVVYEFLLRPTQQTIAVLMRGDVLGLLDGSIALFVIVGVLGAFLGLVMMTKPSLLRELEVASNRWISTADLAKIINRANFSVDRIAFSARTISGIILIIGGVYVALRLGLVLFGGDWRF